MNVKRLFGVLRRHKLLTIGGVLLAVVVAGVAYKELGKPTWQSQSQLLITQGNDPYGAAAQQPTVNAGAGITYMSSLAPIYAAIGNGDVVHGQIQKVAPSATVVASDLADPSSGVTLPLVQFTVLSSTEAGATKLAALAAATLAKYVAAQQAAGHVPLAQRVELSPVQDGAQTKEVSGPSKTTAMLLFVVLLACVIGFEFKLDKSDETGKEEQLAGVRVAPGTDGAHTGAPNRVRAASGVGST